MPVIRLHRYIGHWEKQQFVFDHWEPILFQTDSMTTAETKDEGTKVTYREAMAGSFVCRETLSDIEKLIHLEMQKAK